MVDDFVATLWSIWLARNETIIKNIRWTVGNLLFIGKIRSLQWIKAIKKDCFIEEAAWQSNPSNYVYKIEDSTKKRRDRVK